MCRALSAQWRSVGAVAPERVVASFLCSRLVSCTCAHLLDVHLDSCDRTQSRFIQNSHIHCTIFNIFPAFRERALDNFTASWDGSMGASSRTKARHTILMHIARRIHQEPRTPYIARFPNTTAIGLARGDHLILQLDAQLARVAQRTSTHMPRKMGRLDCRLVFAVHRCACDCHIQTSTNLLFDRSRIGAERAIGIRGAS